MVMFIPVERQPMSAVPTRSIWRHGAPPTNIVPDAAYYNENEWRFVDIAVVENE